MARLRARTSPFLKVCCIQNEQEALLAYEAGASAIGLVSAMPSGPGPISEERIREITRAAPALETVLLSCACDAATLIDQVRRTGVSALQLVDAVAADVLSAVRDAFPDVALLTVVHVVDESSVDEALAYASLREVDALLLDSGNPRLATKELGGTGRVHDWALSVRIVKGSAKPVLLAGGLRSDNVASARERVAPFGFDICSGVRTGGALDPDRLTSFVRALSP